MNRLRLALRFLAPLRLRRDVHVRGRHPARGAAGTGALTGPQVVARADGRRGASGAARSGGDRAVESSLQPAPRNGELHDLLRRAGPLLDGSTIAEFAETLVREAPRCVLDAAKQVFAAARTRGSSGRVGVIASRRCSKRIPRPVHDALTAVARRYARSHGPFTTAELAGRFGLELAVVESSIAGARA